jgi:C4-dicarboxylate transporter DctM subunit
MITPPVGICLFVGCSIARIPMERLSKAIMPFVAILIGVLAMITYLPTISMIVPRLFKIGA